MDFDKASIRAAALQRRDAIPSEVRRAHAQRIIAGICAMDAFREARVVMAYSGFGTEIDTAPLLREITQAGKTLIMPRVSRATGVLEIFRVEDPEADLVDGVWGIREPNPQRCAPCAPEEINLIIMPGAVFDRRGGRIGYGKGYYDKLLGECMRKGHHPATVAGAFEVQVVDAVPMESHDVPVDVLVTELGVRERVT
jgi:5-formyltetrahydrofolate cyclo-ligase